MAVPFDLSDVFFICTANQIEEILPTLRDRLEIVELDGYTLEEKVQIARQHIAGGLAEEHGFDAPLEISEEVTLRCVEDYTREAGVRQLRQKLAALYRDTAVRKLKGADAASMDIDHVRKVLGPAKYRRQDALEAMAPGVVHGLAVGPEGGALMVLEVAKLPGKGELRLTGRLGDVMRARWLPRFRVAAAMPKVAVAAQLDAVPSRIPGQFSSWCLARFALLLDVDVDPSAHAKFLQRADLQAKRPAEHDLASSSARASGALPVFHTGQLRQAATAVRRERVPKLLTLWRRSTWIRTCSVFTVST